MLVITDRRAIAFGEVIEHDGRLVEVTGPLTPELRDAVVLQSISRV